MNRQILRNAIVALSVVSATVAASLAATGCGGGSSRDASTATKSSAVPITAIPEREPRPLGPGEQKLSPGVHVLDLVSLKQSRPGYAHLPRIAFTLPSGWFNYNGWAVNDGGPLGLAFWDVAKVYPSGCRWQGKPKIDPGRTVDGLARVLATRPLRHASSPRDAELAGFRGKYLRWSVPSKIDFSRCGQGYFESWTGRGWASDRWQQGPGQVDRLWILDVSGQRLVIDANYLPTATRADRAELDRVVHSIRFLGRAARRATSASAVTSAVRRRSHRTARNGEWIAYSTTPAGDPPYTTYGSGSDVFVTGKGHRPKLIAGRGSRGEIWNICPVFSPNGRMLAFGRKAPGGSSIVVVSAVMRDGELGAKRAVLKVPGRRASCPRWSSNSARLAYIGGSGRVVVRGLDGSRRRWATGDSTIHDFVRNEPELMSPTGKLVASLSNSGIVVSRPDGSDRRVVNEYPFPYAIAGWSPDGRRLLVMADAGDAFWMRAVSVDAPFASRTVVAYVPVNSDRSWPGYGDVSWQPIPRR